MATLKDYFLLSNKHHVFTVTQTQELTMQDNLKIPVQMFLDFASGSIYLSFYIEKVSDPYQKCLDIILGNAVEAVLKVTGGFEIAAGFPKTNPISATDLKFCGRLFIYSDNLISDSECVQLTGLAKTRGLLIEYCGPDWAEQQAKTEKPLAFISHDSRDKESIAKPLVDELLRFPGCTVWYDEYSLKLGDSLRESIEAGLKECKKCVLLLSKNFLSNNGWTKAEFNSVFTRELIEQQNVVLPIWCGVTRDEIYSYSPSLANRVAENWNKGAVEVAQKIYLAANK